MFHATWTWTFTVVTANICWRVQIVRRINFTILCLTNTVTVSVAFIDTFCVVFISCAYTIDVIATVRWTYSILFMTVVYLLLLFTKLFCIVTNWTLFCRKITFFRLLLLFSMFCRNIIITIVLTTITTIIYGFLCNIAIISVVLIIMNITIPFIFCIWLVLL